MGWFSAPGVLAIPLIDAASGTGIVGTISLLLGGLGSLTLVAVTVLRARADKRNVESSSEVNVATATKSFAEATVIIMNPLKDENIRLNQRQDRMDKELERLREALIRKDDENERLRRELHQEREAAAIEREGYSRTVRDLQERLRDLELGASGG